MAVRKPTREFGLANLMCQNLKRHRWAKAVAGNPWKPQGNRRNDDFIIRPGITDGSKKKNPAEIKNEIVSSHGLQ